MHFAASVTLNFDLLIQKLEAFILVPKCTNAENLVTIKSNNFQDFVLTTFGMHRQTHRLTNNQKTCLRPLRWRRHKTHPWHAHKHTYTFGFSLFSAHFL